MQINNARDLDLTVVAHRWVTLEADGAESVQEQGTGVGGQVPWLGSANPNPNPHPNPNPNPNPYQVGVAPEPSDVFWPNLELSRRDRVSWNVANGAILVVCGLTSAAALVVTTLAAEAYRQERSEEYLCTSAW